MKKKSSNPYSTVLGTFHLPENNIDKENNSCLSSNHIAPSPHHAAFPKLSVIVTVAHFVQISSYSVFRIPHPLPLGN